MAGVISTVDLSDLAAAIAFVEANVGLNAVEIGHNSHDLSAIEHGFHSRWRVYPQNVGLVATLTADAVADTFGNWVEIIPLDTVPFPYDVIGVVLEVLSASTTYHVQLGYSVDAGDPPANHEAGERRFKIATIPAVRATELLEIASQNIPANAKLWGRVKTASINADTCQVSVVLDRHIEITNPEPLYGAFPW